MNKGDFKSFNSRVFSDCNIKWFDRMGVYTIDDNRRAEIETVTSGTRGTYDAYEVRIIHKENGIITHHKFPMNTYMGPNDRVDNRRDCSENFKIIEHCGIDWYISRPSNDATKRLRNAILDFIEIYK